jgi:hypothetical protein
MKTQTIALFCLLTICPLTGVQSQQQAILPAQEESSASAEQAQSPDHEFTLKGISRFGDKYHVAIVAGDGNRVEVDWNIGEESTLEGYPGVNVIEVREAKVTLTFPAEEACFEQIEPELDCSANRTTQTLTLAVGPPLPYVDPNEATDNPETFIDNYEQVVPITNDDGVAIDPELIIRGEELEEIYGIRRGQAINRASREAQGEPAN